MTVVERAQQMRPPKKAEPEAGARAMAGPQHGPLVQLASVLNARPMVQRVAAGGAALSANRTGLPDRLKSGIESLSGLSMDGVRVHYGSAAPAQFQAHAYAQGRDIHIAPGQERHLPHEAWHVVQQAQGRVRPTAQLKAAIPINDESGLEREADLMGARALTFPGGAAALAPLPLSTQNAPLQPKWIVRVGGALDWVADSYVLQPGETEPFSSTPAVTFDHGNRQAVFDSTGKSTVTKRKSKEPTYKKLQETRKSQGAELRKRLKSDPTVLSGQTQELASFTDHLEAAAGNSVPSNHRAKIKKLFQSGDITGDDYRDVIKGQDEFTQSGGTSSFFGGLLEHGGDTPPHVSPALDDYAETALRFSSSLRGPTESIFAPISDNGTITGQQHPTSDAQPVLPGGRSGHNYADRNRVHQQNLTFSAAIKAPKAPPNAILLATGLVAASTTLTSLSAPSAKNLPKFDPSRADTQLGERENIKKQTNLIAKQLGQTITTSTQDDDELWRAHPTLTSPLRKKPSSKPTGLSSSTPVTTTPVSSTSLSTPVTGGTTTSPLLLPKVKLKKLIDLSQAVHHTAQALLAAMPGPQQDVYEVNRQNFRAYMQQVIGSLALIDLADPLNEARLQQMYTNLNTVFVNFRAYLVRSRHVYVGGTAHDPGGQRLAALPQFFAECGQMAVHNADVLLAFPQLVNPHAINAQQAQAALFSDAQATGHGAFQNDIDEGQIAQMLATAGRADIPVLGNLVDAQGVLDLVRAGNTAVLNQHLIGQQERQNAARINGFIDGNLNSLVMVINTTGHEQASGFHWISVRITRAQNGTLGITYLDSLLAPTDYTGLFTALRQFMGGVPHQVQLQGNINTSS